MKNNIYKFTVFFLTSFVVSNCGPIVPVDSNKGLKFSVSQRIDLRNSVNDSCASTNATTGKPDKALKAVSFQIPKISIDWTGPAELIVETITVTLASPSLAAPYVCPFTGSDLLSTWIFMHGATDGNGGILGCPPTGTGILYSSIVITPSTMAGATTAMPAAIGSRCYNTMYTSNACPFRCGGVTFLDNKLSASGSVEVKIDGYYAATDGTYVTVSLKKYMTFSYNP